MKKEFFVILIYFILTIIFLNFVSSNAEKPAREICQETVNDQEYFKQYTKSPELKELRKYFDLLNTSIGSCINYGNLFIILNYKTKKNMSSFNVSYNFQLSLNFNKSQGITALLSSQDYVDRTHVLSEADIKEIVEKRIYSFEKNKKSKNL